MKKILLAFAFLAIGGCGDGKIYVDSTTGQRVAAPEERSLESMEYFPSAPRLVSRTCIEGVVYLSLGHGFTVAFKPDGSVAKCKGAQLL